MDQADLFRQICTGVVMSKAMQLMLAFSLGIGGMAVAGCDDRSDTEKAIDRAADNAKDAAKDVEKGTKKAADKVDDAAKKTADKVKDATN
jgi:hypothetical protein